MKKVIALMLSLALLLGCVAAVAETAGKEKLGAISVNGQFELQCKVPEGYTVSSLTDEEGTNLIATITPGTGDQAIMMLSVAFDELLSDVKRLNDLDEEGLAHFEESFREEDDVDISYTETALGTKLMVVKEKEGVTNFVDFFTVYEGYSIEFVLLSGYELDDEVGVTDEQIELAVQFLSDLDFVPVA